MIYKLKVNIFLFVVGGFIFSAGCGWAQNGSGAESDAMVFEKRFDLRIKENKISSKEVDRLAAGMDRHSILDYEYDAVGFTLQFRNKGSIELTDLNVEYRFYYEVDQRWSQVQQAGVMQNAKNESRIESKKGSFKVESLGPGDRHEEEVGPFMLENYRIQQGYYMRNAPEEIESSAMGLWVRVSYKTSDGQTIIRDFCDPKKLSEDDEVSW